MNIGQGLFVTGTDTGVGKTVVAAGIAGALRDRGINAGVMKPFQTGAIKTPLGWSAPDAYFLKAASGVDDEIDLICPVCLELPLAPSVAAKLTGSRVTIDDILPSFEELSRRHPFLIVEGAGGLGVPIDGKVTMRDLANKISFPLLIIAKPGLGTINHTLLTVEYALATNLKIAGIVISNYPDDPGIAERTNPNAIEKMTGVPVLGLVKHDPLIDTETGSPGDVVKALISGPVLENLLERLLHLNSNSSQQT
jgi:dethiobiotin synthetase